jgi:hypothetical protein
MQMRLSILPSWSRQQRASYLEVWIRSGCPDQRSHYSCGISRLSSIEPAKRGDHVERGQEIPCGLIVTRRDGAELLDPTEEVLDQMTSHIQRFVVRSGALSVLFWRNHGGFPDRLQRLDHPLVRVVSFVREQHFRFHPGHQRIRPGEVVDLPGGQDDFQRITQRVRQNVDFGAQATFAFPDRQVFPGFFLAPALC